jgi:zinc protease
MRAVVRRRAWPGFLTGTASLWWVLFGIGSVWSADDQAPQHVTTVEGISEFRLDNGLKILLFPDPSKPTVTVNLTIFVGSRHEGYGEAGMAHLLEHMVFKGTPTFKDIPKELKDRGAEYNGTTWLDRTNYFETLPASDENLEFAIKLEADRMINSLIKAEDLASEMTVVRNEFERGENSPQSVLMERMFSAAFEWHNYGKSTIGNRADIERVPVENLRRFYRQYYQPDNAMLVVAGRFEPETALRLATKHFGPIPKPQRVLENTYTEEPAQDGERIVTLRRVGDVAVVGSVYHIPAGPHPEFAAIDVMESILTQAPAGKLYKALVETRKAANVFGGAFALHDPGVLLFMAEVAKGNDAQVVLDAMLDEIDKFVKTGVTDDDVERARQKLLKNRELQASDSSGLAIELSEWAAQGDWRLYFLYRDRLEKVTADDVQRVAAAYLKQNNRTVGMYLPTKTPERVHVPPTPSLAEMIGDYRGRENVAVGEAFDVDALKIESRTVRVTLPGGLKAAFLPKKTRNEAVTLRLTLRFGNEESLAGKAKAAEMLPGLMARGTQKLSRQELTDLLDKNRTALGASGSLRQPGVAHFSLTTQRKYLPTALDLLRQVLREPAFAETEFETLKTAQLARLEKQKSDPTALAQTAVSKQLNPYPGSDPRYVPSAPEEIEMLNGTTLATIKELYQEMLGARHGELVVIGDFDLEPTREQVTQMLAGWEPKSEYRRIVRKSDVKVPGNVQSLLTPDKASATYFGGLVFPMRDDHPDFAALSLGNFIFGHGSLSSRLGNRVREKDGLSYGIGTGLQVPAVDDRALFYVYAICNPDNMPKVEQAIREEFELLLKDGVTAAELEAAKQGFLQGERVGRTEDNQLAAIISESLEVGRTLKYQADLEARVLKVTPEDVLRVCRKYLDPKNLVIVEAGDFRKSGE